MTRTRRTRSRFPAWWWAALVALTVAALVGVEDHPAATVVIATVVGLSIAADVYRREARP